MRAGKLRHRVEVQRSTATQDTYGQQVITWGTFAILWADIRPSEATETFESGQFKTERRHVVRMRYYDQLTTRNRLKFGTRYFDVTGIRYVREIEREMVVDCVERI
jgi:SPP1 family predicted phage head-tail adaptor